MYNFASLQNIFLINDKPMHCKLPSFYIVKHKVLKE